MMVAAATDHFYRDGGHLLDFINKSFEVLERIGWDKATEILPHSCQWTPRLHRGQKNRIGGAVR